VALVVLSVLRFANAQGQAQGRVQRQAQSCTQTLFAKVVALDQAFYVNRYGEAVRIGERRAANRGILSQQVTPADLDAATVRSAALPDGWQLGLAGPSCASGTGDRRVLRELTRAPKNPQDPNRGVSCVKLMDDGFIYTLGDQRSSTTTPSTASKHGAPARRCCRCSPASASTRAENPCRAT
jgi:hypothetical protein